jgi:GT2 family glycosyltransferase
MVSIVIPTYNHLEDCLQPCLESVIKYTDLTQTEVLVIANGCTDGTADYVNGLSQAGLPIRLIWNDAPLGYTKATNIGFREARGEYVIALNNDTILLPQALNGWVDELLVDMKKNPLLGITGPLELYCPSTNQPFIVFFCAALRKSMLDRVGILDEIFSPGGCEDIDLCLRARKAGYQVKVLPGNDSTQTFPIYHKAEATFSGESGWSEIFERNNDILKERAAAGYYSNPKVSVIVTSHNYGQFLNECLTSIVQQTYKDYELIVFDDASTDNTSEIAKTFAPINLIRMETKVGVVHANNLAIAQAKGKYICLINADDFIQPTYLEKCAQVLDQFPKVGIAYTWFWHFGGDEPTNPVVFPEFTLESLKSWNYILGSAMFRASAYFDVGGFSSTMSSGMEDYDMWLSICERGWEAKLIPEHLYNYRRHGLNTRSNQFNFKVQCCKLWRKHNMPERTKEFKEVVDVTATISTKGRYQTTLPLAMMAIAMQTYAPKEFILFDDNDVPQDLRKEAVYENIFRMFDERKIAWRVVFGKRVGQVQNHQLAIDLAKHPWIWRLDDDNVPEATALEKLVDAVAPDVGAVGGLVLDPKNLRDLPDMASSKIEDIFLGMNIQWFKQKGLKMVDHLYSSFLFRRDAATHGYCMELSPAGHREETMFTYLMTRAGWTLLVNPESVTWHFQAPQGGIRTFTQREYWEQDDQLFRQKLKDWGVHPRETKIICLNSGLGDHLAFRSVLEDVRRKYKDHRLVLAVCYPEVFEDDGLPLISIAEAEAIMGKSAVDEQNIYKFCWDRNWKKPLAAAYKEMFA